MRKSLILSRKRIKYLLVFSVFVSFFLLIDIWKVQAEIGDQAYWRNFNSFQNTFYPKYEKAKPFLRPESKKFVSYAQSALVVETGKERVLFSKNPQKQLPIASLTKIMTVLVSLDNYPLEKEVTFSSRAAEKEGEPNFYHEGEKFPVRELLYSALIESSNRAATALAEVMGEKEFVRRMNVTAQRIGMSHTKFFNPTGLDPDFPNKEYNYSSVADMLKLIKLAENNDIFRQAAHMKKRGIRTSTGEVHHWAQTTNMEFGNLGNLSLFKTGHTPLAQRCLALATKNPYDQNQLIIIVLGAQDNFKEVKRLLNWTYESYRF